MMHLIGSVDFLSKEAREKLIERARNSVNYEEFRVETGWEDWMEDFAEAKEGDPLSESDSDRVDAVLKEAWEKAHQN